MVMSVNKVTVIGHLGKDPESRTTQGGAMVVSFSVSTTQKWNDKMSGEKKERTEWIPVVIFSEGLCKLAEKYLQKGDPVYVEGEWRTRKWEKDGIERWTTECVLTQFNGKLCLLSSNRNNDSRSNDSRGNDSRRETTNSRSSASSIRNSSPDPWDDEIPF